jgi:hypothetical protein
MNMDIELAEWRTDWLAEAASETAMLRPELQRLVDRKRRRMALALVGELLFGAAMLAFSAWFASLRPTLEWMLWAAVIWAGTFFASGFKVWNKAGTWKALRQSNAAFLDLARRRSQRELRAIHIGRWFLAVQLAIVAPWLSWDFAIHRLPLGAYLLGIAVTILLAAAYLSWFAARERGLLHNIRDLEASESGALSA